MKVVYIGPKNTDSTEHYNQSVIKKGEVYEVTNKKVTVNEVPCYSVKMDDDREEIFPTVWFFNLTDLLETYSAQTVILDAPIHVGDRAFVTLGWKPRGDKGGYTIGSAHTSPIEQVEKLGGEWYLFRTKSQHWYIGPLNPDLIFELLN